MLLGELRVLHSPLDRWGHTPLDDAVRSGDDRTIDLLMDEGAESAEQTWILLRNHVTHNLYGISVREWVFSASTIRSEQLSKNDRNRARRKAKFWALCNGIGRGLLGIVIPPTRRGCARPVVPSGGTGGGHLLFRLLAGVHRGTCAYDRLHEVRH